MKKILALLTLTLILPVVAHASDYHVLRVSEDGRKAQVAFHIPIPDATNSASYSYRSAVSEYVGGAGFVSQVPWVLAVQEQSDLEAGLLYETTATVNFTALDSDLQKQTKIDNKFTSLSSVVLLKLQAILKFWQFNRDVN